MEGMIDDPRPDTDPRVPEISPELAAAMKAYHDHKAAQWAASEEERKSDGFTKWDKDGDLDRIWKAVGENAYLAACVGHFTIDWPNGTRTEHDEGYLDGIVSIIKDDNGDYWRLRDFCGKKLPEPEKIILKGDKNGQ